MKQSINRSQFHDAFINMGRENNFSHLGRIKLFEYLEELEESCGVEIELDVIALCCDYYEEKLETVLKEHDLESIEELREHTQVIEVDDETVIYQGY